MHRDVFQAILYWLEIHTGTVNESGPYYGFFSGFGSDIAEFAILGGVVQFYRQHNCHVKRCKRFKTFKFVEKATGNEYKLCKKHHPSHNTQLSHVAVIKMHKENHADDYER